MVACWCGSDQLMGECGADHEAASQRLQEAGHVPKSDETLASRGPEEE